MTELEERLLAEVTRLQAGMNDMSAQLTAINERLDDSTKLFEALKSELSNFLTQQQNFSREQQKFSQAQEKFSQAQEKLSSPLESLQAHFTKK